MTESVTDLNELLSEADASGGAESLYGGLAVLSHTGVTGKFSDKPGLVVEVIARLQGEHEPKALLWVPFLSVAYATRTPRSEAEPLSAGDVLSAQAVVLPGKVAQYTAHPGGLLVAPAWKVSVKRRRFSPHEEPEWVPLLEASLSGGGA